MDFLIKLQNSKLKSQSLREIQSSHTPALTVTDIRSAFKIIKYVLAEMELWVVGDVVFPDEILSSHQFQAEFLVEHIKLNKVFQLKGFFYLICLDYKNNNIKVFPCFLNILPIYYANCGETIIVSGSLMEVYRNLESTPEPNEEYIVEKALFYYPFLDHTPFRNIFLLPTSFFVNISEDGVELKRYYSLEELIHNDPKPWGKSLNTLSDVYCKEMVSYVPNDPFAVTLTGGFDGRTVCSAALNKNAVFRAFSYGRANDSDVSVPEIIAKTLNFPYTSFLLDNEYAKNHFWNDGLEFLLKSEGVGNISRAHYVYTARVLSANCKYLLTGNFGSEVIRSLKNPGVMASESVFALFDNDSKAEFELFVRSRGQLKFLNKEMVDKYLPSVIDRVWDYKLNLPKVFGKNKKFYTYVFEEAFRKYFGPEVVLQSDYFINRSPFIDYSIFKSTLETSIAGVYQNFREKRPLKRFHGQILYAHIIKKLEPALLDIMLDKNYKPGNFLTMLGRLNITLGYFSRIVFKKNKNKNPTYSEDFYKTNREDVIKSINESLFLNKENVLEVFNSGDYNKNQNEFVNIMSMDLFFQKHKCLSEMQNFLF